MNAVQMAQMQQMEQAYAQYQQQAGLTTPGSNSRSSPYAAAAAPAATNSYSDSDWGVPGFGEALTESVTPIHQTGVPLDSDQMHAIEDIKNKVGTKILKSLKKFQTDERLAVPGTGLAARALVEEFVDWAAGAVSQAFYDKPWLEKVNLAAPLLAAALHTFNGSKIFTRTLAPMLPKYIEEALFRYAEEERVNKAMFDAVVASGVKENMQKKASQHLAKAYDNAHVKAPYGSTTADSAELGMLQDFVRGWMGEFIGIAKSDVLTYGIDANGARPQKSDQILFLTVLFQNLTDARNAALPHELTSLIDTPPPSPWAFIAETVEATFNDVETSAAKVASEKAARNMGDMMGGMMNSMGGMEGMMNMMSAMEGMMMMEGMMEGMMGMDDGFDMGGGGFDGGFDGKGKGKGKGCKGGGKGFKGDGFKGDGKGMGKLKW